MANRGRTDANSASCASTRSSGSTTRTTGACRASSPTGARSSLGGFPEPAPGTSPRSRKRSSGRASWLSCRSPVTNIADTHRASSPADWIRTAGVLLFGAALLMVANTDLPVPLPWAYGLLPFALFWLARHVGLLYGALAATATLGAVYAAGVTEPSRLLFVAVLCAAGLLLSASARRGVRASTAMTVAAAPILAVVIGYLLLGGMDELTRTFASRLADVRRLESDHRVSETLGVSRAEFDLALAQLERVYSFLLPSLFALKWVTVLSVNCWLASVLFRERGLPAFRDFSTWRVHPAAAWAFALALALIATRAPWGTMAGANLAFPLLLGYTVQGLAVARFTAIAFEMNAMVQGAIVVLVAFMPILFLTFLGIGFLDSWFDFRRRLVPGPDDSVGRRADKSDD